MDSNQLLKRTKKFALDVIKFFISLPKTDEARILGKQLLRSSTSVASNYRAACLSRSKREFYAKMCIVVEETDESLFWIELFRETRIRDDDIAKLLMNEARELLFIFSSAKKTTKSHLNQSMIP